MNTEIKTKECSKCKQEKSVSEFYTNKRTSDGLQWWCKKCMNNYHKTNGSNNKIKLNDTKADYRGLLLELQFHQNMGNGEIKGLSKLQTKYSCTHFPYAKIPDMRKIIIDDKFVKEFRVGVSQNTRTGKVNVYRKITPVLSEISNKLDRIIESLGIE